MLTFPKDENELQHMLYTALKLEQPAAIRYPRRNGRGVKLDTEFEKLSIGRAQKLCEGKDVLFICYGPIISEALAAAAQLKKEFSISSTIINARFAKPMDKELLVPEILRHFFVCTLEDHALAGGFGSAVLELLEDCACGRMTPIKRFGVGDCFVPHASQSEQYQMHGYDTESIYAYFANLIRKRMVEPSGIEPPTS